MGIGIEMSVSRSEARPGSGENWSAGFGYLAHQHFDIYETLYPIPNLTQLIPFLYTAFYVILMGI